MRHRETPNAPLQPTGYVRGRGAPEGQVHDTAVEIGSALLPVLTPLFGRLVEVVKIVSDPFDQ